MRLVFHSYNNPHLISTVIYKALLLCPCRDTLLDVSTEYLGGGSKVQWLRQGLDNQVETEDERNQWIARVRQRQSWDLLHSDWHGFCKPTGSWVRVEKVRVQVAFCVPEHNPYPPQGFCGFATGTLRVQILLHLLMLRNTNTDSQISILKNLVHYHPPDSILIQPSYARMVVGHVACCCTFVRIFLASAASLFKSPSLHQLHLPSACHCQERVLRISQTHYNLRADWHHATSPLPQVTLRLDQFKEAWEQARSLMIKAQESWVKHRDTPKYKEGNLVWLEGQNLRLSQPTPKLAPRRHGPFKVVQVMSPVTYHLELPTQWSIHPVFHIDLLTPYQETITHGANYLRPPPNLVDSEEEYEVEKILDSQLFGRRK